MRTLFFVPVLLFRIHFTGDTYGFAGLGIYDPKLNFGFAIASNNESSDMGGLNVHVNDAFCRTMRSIFKVLSSVNSSQRLPHWNCTTPTTA
jgi:hypothetical protein